MGSLESQAQIPIIDLSASNLDAPRQLLDAASKYGFVFVENNEAGVPAEEIARMFDISQRFFAAPVAEKESVSIKSNSVGKNHGWLSQGVEMLDPSTQKRADVKEYVVERPVERDSPDTPSRAFNMGEPVNGQLEQLLPPTLQPHSATIVAFQRACHALCQRLNEAFATALGLKRDWFTSRHAAHDQASSSVFRMLYYPCGPDYEEGVDIRAGAHSDFGSMTLLFQQRGQPGLEILTPAGQWAPVPVDPREGGGGRLPILVNIGDLLEDWTGGLLKSTMHRVIFPSGGPREARYSMAYFCHPLDEAELVPVPSPLIAEHAARVGRTGGKDGNVLTAADHLRERLATTYKLR